MQNMQQVMSKKQFNLLTNEIFLAGPVTARHIANRMYRGEYFAMQLDAHCIFVNRWDSKLIDQWKSTRNEMAVLRLVQL